MEDFIIVIESIAPLIIYLHKYLKSWKKPKLLKYVQGIDLDPMYVLEKLCNRNFKSVILILLSSIIIGRTIKAPLTTLR